MDRVFEGLYDSLDDVNALDGALHAFADRLGAKIATLCVIDRLRETTLLIRSVNIPAAIPLSYLPMIPIDPWFEAAARLHGPSLFVGAQLVEQKAIRRSSYYQGLMRPNSLDYMMGCGVVGTTVGSFLTSHRALGTSDFSTGSIDYVRRYMPHVVRVGRLMVDRSHGVALQDTGAFPMLRIGREGIEFVNERAWEWINHGKVALLTGSRLRLKNRSVDQLLVRYLAKTLAGDASSVPAAPLEFSVKCDGGSYRLLVLPTVRTTPLLTREPGALIIVLDGGCRVTQSHADVLGITNAEAQLANALISGTSTNDYAKASNRSLHTVRTHIKSLFVKLGVHTQAQLVRKLLLQGMGEAELK